MSSERLLDSKTGGRAATTGMIPGDFAIAVGNPGTPLADGWAWTLLMDVARLETGHTPSRQHPEYWGGEVPWIGIRDATGNHGQKIFETAQYTNELGIRNSSARILPSNTVCLSRTASVGYVVVMGVPMATSQDFVNWVCGPKLDYRFLKYVLLGERNSFLRFASGTTHQTIYFPEVKAFYVAMPDIGIQRSIADVLSALDDRIALLRETNATLEAIAQALFKSWFVDFNPVRAKMEGRVPEGMDEATAALFPDALVESELGLVPKGWRVGTLADLSDLNPESWTAKNHPETVAYIDLANAKDNVIASVSDFTFDDAPSRARRVLRDGDTIVGTVRPGNRSFAFIHEPASNLTASTGFAVLRPLAAANTEFVYLAATQDTSIEHLAHVADGGAYPAVRPEVVSG
jgi:restriction endonuclease S subunit